MIPPDAAAAAAAGVRPRAGFGRWLGIGLLGIHVVWCVARVPSRVVERRFDDVAEYRERGAAAFFLDRQHVRGAEVVRWLDANVPAEAVVLWRGEWRGALEFVPALLAPRLLVAEGACPPGARTYAGRPLAVRRGPDGEAVVVVEGLRTDLRLGQR